MSRIVVLSFADNDIAEAFVKMVDDGGAAFTADMAVIAGAHAEIESVRAKPTLFCTCNVEYSNKNFAKSTRYGWTVHIKCKRPTKEWADRHVLSQAHDLLPEMRKNHATDPGDG